MIRALYRTETGELHSELRLHEIKSEFASAKGLLWVDLDTADPEGRPLLEQAFGFHPLAVDDCYNGHLDTPKVDDYDAYLFIEAQGIDYSMQTNRLVLTELGLFLGPHYVVTIHEKPIDPIEQLLARAQGNSPFMARGADFLTHTILDVVVDQLLPAAEEMDEKLDDLERSILEDPDKELLSEVLQLKRNILRLRRSILPQRDLVNQLSRGEFPKLIRPEALIFYRDVYDHVVRIESLLEGLRDLADSALNSYLSSVNNRMNEVMKALSVVAVVFLPLTLIASIYGTNLDLAPFGLTFKYGFEFMIGAMLTLSAAMALYFRRRGWF
jgi:magnesium transporter